jgi:hypothetical protein
MEFFKDINKVKIDVQKSFLDINKWEMVVSEDYSFVDINAIADIFEIEVEALVDNAKEYNGMYYEKGRINEYNGLLFDSKKECKKFINNYMSSLLLLLRLQLG